MKLKFTKMHGTGNDFIVVNALQQRVDLSAAQWQQLADRHFGIGADQILIVAAPRDPANDFSYRIINNDGSEVEHCGNGARAFFRYVTEQGLTQKTHIKVEIQPGVIELEASSDGQVKVAMGVPEFRPEKLPFTTQNLNPKFQQEFVHGHEQQSTLWPLEVNGNTRWLHLISMGNPHAVQLVEDLEHAPVIGEGALIETHVRFPQRVNAGFMQVLSRHAIKLRVWERGAGETLACGTGACAAAVSAIQRGLADSPLQVHTRGGALQVTWQGTGQVVYLSGPAVSVFDGEVTIPA